jgi:hypothetical protein
MTQPPQPTEPFAQHPRLAELVTALGFRRYPLFLTGLLYEEPGGPRRPWWTPWPTATRRSPPTRWPAGPGGRRSINEIGIELLERWFLPERPPFAITHSEVLVVVPLEVTDALLDEFRRLADRHQRGFMVEHVMELLATS